MSDALNHQEQCPGCGAPSSKRQPRCTECHDYMCGSMILCDTADFALPAGLVRHSACVALESKGGWGNA